MLDGAEYSFYNNKIMQPDTTYRGDGILYPDLLTYIDFLIYTNELTTVYKL